MSLQTAVNTNTTPPARKLRGFLETLRRIMVPELVSDLKTLVVDSTLLLVLHLGQVAQSDRFHGAAVGEMGLLRPLDRCKECLNGALTDVP